MALYPSDSYQPQATPRRPGDGAWRRLRKRALAFMALALVCGLGAAALITRAIVRRAGRLVPVPMVKVAVAAAPLPTATALQRESIALVDWPETALPDGSFRDFGALEGRVTSTPL